VELHHIITIVGFVIVTLLVGSLIPSFIGVLRDLFAEIRYDNAKKREASEAKAFKYTDLSQLGKCVYDMIIERPIELNYLDNGWAIKGTNLRIKYNCLLFKGSSVGTLSKPEIHFLFTLCEELGDTHRYMDQIDLNEEASRAILGE
jgi:hypothetical protein